MTDFSKQLIIDAVIPTSRPPIRNGRTLLTYECRTVTTDHAQVKSISLSLD